MSEFRCSCTTAFREHALGVMVCPHCDTLEKHSDMTERALNNCGLCRKLDKAKVALYYRNGGK